MCAKVIRDFYFKYMKYNEYSFTTDFLPHFALFCGLGWVGFFFW